MSCNRAPFYVPATKAGIVAARNNSDGYSITLEWTRAYPDSTDYQVVYHIYYSTIKEDLYAEGVKFVVINSSALTTEVCDLVPGDIYYFAVRASEFESDVVDLSLLPDAGDSKYYPEGVLLSDITDEDISIPVSDIEMFPAYGLIIIGSEVIYYSNKDIPNSLLTGVVRGYYGTNVRLHTTDGYDGYKTYDNSLVRFWGGYEEQNLAFFQETCSFEWKNWAYTENDGYKEEIKDILTTDMSSADEDSQDFPLYDTAGWRRTDVADMLAGNCVGSYFGGERNCATDGGINQVRGSGVNDESNAREEFLLGVTGKAVTLVKRRWTGTRCKCYQSTSEYPESRCPFCFGSGFIVGFEQFFNPRRSDGKILMRFDTADEDLVLNNAGLDSVFSINGWTVTYPAIKDRDFIIRYNQDGTEEFRYEVQSVGRNQLLGTAYGAQRLKLQRVRKTDPIYTIKVFIDSSTMPQLITTGVGFYNGIPHTHTLVISEQITSVGQINQISSISQNHSHVFENGICKNLQGEAFGAGFHTHELIL